MHKAWHAANPLPRGGTQEERLAWHVAHARHCGCRPMPPSLRALVREDGARVNAPRVARNPRPSACD